VDIALVSHIKNYMVARTVKYAHESNAQLNYAEVGREVSACLGYFFDKKTPDLLAEIFKVGDRRGLADINKVIV
jgi:hypothetical protein